MLPKHIWWLNEITFCFLLSWKRKQKYQFMRSKTLCKCINSPKPDLKPLLRLCHRFTLGQEAISGLSEFPMCDFFLCFSTPVTAEWKFPDVVAVHCGILIWVACGIWSFISLACRNLATIAIADTGGYCLEDIDFRMLWLLSYQYHHSENKYKYY